MSKVTHKKKLKIGVIGLGSMGKNHVRVFKNLDRVELIAVSDIDNSLLSAISGRYKLKPYKDYRKMLQNENLDIVTIALPTGLHYKAAKDVILNGINLLVEKPLAAKSSEASEIIRIAKEKNVHLGVGHTERFNPVIAELKRQIENSRLGRVFQITIRRIGPFPARVKDTGVLLDLATHDIDIMYYLSGAEIVRVSCETRKVLHDKYEDLAVGILRFKNGIVGTLIENWLSPTKIRDAIINGEKGMYIVDFLTQDLYFYENNYTPAFWDSLGVFRGMTEGNMVRYYINRDEPLRLELEAFVDSVLNNKPFLVNGVDGLRAVELVEKLFKQANRK